MNAFSPITPMKAVELVEAAGVEDAPRIIADFAAHGLVKSYALVIETIDARGVSACVRGAAIPADLWRRIVLDGIGDDVWASGTVRLSGSDMIGDEPAAIITGITFSPKHIDWLIAHQAGAPQPRRRKPKASAESHATVIEVVDPSDATISDIPPVRRKADPAAIPPGALLATIDQAKSALGVSRRTIYNLLESTS